MPPISRLVQRIGSLDFTEGQVDTLEITRNGLLAELRLRLQFTCTHTGTPSTGPKHNALAALFKRIELTLNGRDTVLQIDGPMAIARAIYEQQQVPFAQKGGSYASSWNDIDVTASTATAYDVIVPLPFYFPQSLHPLSAGLPTRRFLQVSLEVTWGAVADLFTSVNAGTTISLVTCTVEGDYLRDVPKDRAFYARILDMKKSTLPGTTDAHDIQIDVGTGNLLRTLIVTSIDDGVAVDTMLPAADGVLELISGPTSFQKRDSAFLRADNALRFSRAAHQTGVHLLTLEKFGDPQMMLNTSRDLMPADLILRLNATHVGGTNEFYVGREMVRPFKA